MSRRSLLKGSAAAGALLVVHPRGALAAPLGPQDAYGTARASRLFPGTWVVHTDMHNHSLLSDGAGDPELAYASMRDAGLDVACLTDHTVTGSLLAPDDVDGMSDLTGMDADSYEVAKRLADAANEDGEFTSLHGFEWSSPVLGHLNVWFSEAQTDPLITGGFAELNEIRFLLPVLANALGVEVDVADVLERLEAELEGTPGARFGMDGFYAWLQGEQARSAAGEPALVGFNHPGREAQRFEDFAFEPALKQRMVSIELFNRREDYLYRIVNGRSPLVACLDAGWVPGLFGVTDEHGTDWGQPDGQGRCGFWVDELTRAGVRAAMLDRRVYATVLRGLRLDAAANGVRMGRALGHREGVVRIELDIDRGPEWVGKPLVAQVLTTGASMPQVLLSEPFEAPGDDDPLPAFEVEVDAADVPWLVVRITDPETPAPDNAPEGWRSDGAAIAYASPWFLDPDLATDEPEPEDPDPDEPDPDEPDPDEPDPDEPDPDPDPGPEEAEPEDPPSDREPGPRDTERADRLPRTQPVSVDRADPARATGTPGRVPDRRPAAQVTELPSTGGVPWKLGSLLVGAGAGLLALRRRDPAAREAASDPNDDLG